MDSSFFAKNRSRLIQLLGSDQAIFVNTSLDQREVLNADFWYLTGIKEPGWRLVLDGGSGRVLLISPDVSEVERVFEGGLSHDEARTISGIDEVVDSRAAGQIEKRLSAKRDCCKELARLRAIKQSEEVEVMTQAATITVEALRFVKGRLKEYGYEYRIDADITHQFRWQNARHAFDPIVASGNNACTLHYGHNSDKAGAGSLVLIDIGARVGGYAADVTRTYAIGEPTKRQVAIHEAVRLAERQIIELIRPGLRIEEYLKTADSVMREALLSLGLMKTMKDDASFRRYFPHAMSHGLGIDVHESLGGYEEFMPGMVLTVEPGIYIPEEGIGVRIEDSVLVGDAGVRNLTGSLSTEYR